MSDLEIEARDVVKTVLQFCKENSLHQTFQTLQNESQVSLNAVDKTFIVDIKKGRWDAVLPQVAQLKLPRKKLENLYEQIVIEMIEFQKLDVARAILYQTQVMDVMNQEQPERYLRLQHLLFGTYFDHKEAYQGSTKEKRRTRIAKELADEVSVVPPSRLLALIGQALRCQRQHQGQLFWQGQGTQFDLFRGRTAMKQQDVDEACPTRLARTINFAKKSHPSCAKFSPDGQFLVSGSCDGFLEVWDHVSGQLIKKDLQYQAEADETCMAHYDPVQDTFVAVQCVDISADSELLASGSKDGMLKVWRIQTGKCFRRFRHAHSGAVTSVMFSPNGTHLLSTSLDGTARIHGIKSGSIAKEFRGHTSFVNNAVYTSDGRRIITASSDGTVKIWDVKNSNCEQTFIPPPPLRGGNANVISVHLSPKSTDHVLVCTDTSDIYLMTLQGQVVKSFSSGGSDFVAACVSPKGDWIYGVGEDRNLYCFGYQSGRLELLLRTVHEKYEVGLTHHPYLSLIATYSEDCKMKLWKP